MEPIALSIEDTRKTLGGIGRTKLYDMLKPNGPLRSFKVGTRTLVTTESIRAFVASQTD
jgi:hypothetical protein